MSAKTQAIRAGVSRGWIELRQTFSNPQDAANYVLLPVIIVIVLFFMRNSTVPGTNFPLAAMVLPSAMGMVVVFSGMVGCAAALTVDREDGTLLRARATPNGILGYVVGRSVQQAGSTFFNIPIVLIAAFLLFDELRADEPQAWLLTIAVMVLAFAATLPLGAIIGALGNNPRNVSLLMVPAMAVAAISGIFYPITALPGWLQSVGQAFPMYWAGLGMRSALLPDSMVTAEIDESWRHWQMIGVLGLWAVLGYALAPIVLRRMARRESGSAVAGRRQKALQRTQAQGI